ncbi:MULTISPECIES: aldo/keto reductase [Pontibacillus]|uniref:Aldo/keto reductase n=1 Tax=Pontibacillus chungwhensis TaxID=265426 RepID=A0ABY8V2K5_9BACI|nr:MULTISPECIES: aldo/keto reductase [Pontibacillus]MCD5322198.1 aldo/keto reductase [Pontibacillus sp. HN14]WIF99492.1 aldo/keto reductase [Pontibacillus chungwhensis]
MILNQKYTLSNGVEIPKLGLGTWKIDNDDVAQTVREAINAGYRHIDTAQAYENERGVGEGILASSVKRDELFITSKVAAEIKSYDEAVASIDQSLERLGLEFIDLMLIHCPQPWNEFGSDNRYLEENRNVWRALEEAYEAGKVRAIGVSNFQQVDLENILNECNVKPMANQILANITHTPLDLIQYTQDQGILVEAYSPLAHGDLLKNEELEEIAEKYGVSVAQLSIRFDLQLGLLPLPKTVTPERMKTNTEVDFKISEEDMDYLKKV